MTHTIQCAGHACRLSTSHSRKNSRRPTRNKTGRFRRHNGSTLQSLSKYARRKRSIHRCRHRCRRNRTRNLCHRSSLRPSEEQRAIRRWHNRINSLHSSISSHSTRRLISSIREIRQRRQSASIIRLLRSSTRCRRWRHIGCLR